MRVILATIFDHQRTDTKTPKSERAANIGHVFIDLARASLLEALPLAD